MMRRGKSKCHAYGGPEWYQCGHGQEEKKRLAKVAGRYPKGASALGIERRSRICARFAGIARFPGTENAYSNMTKGQSRKDKFQESIGASRQTVP
jgi:hypothetical protein